MNATIQELMQELSVDVHWAVKIQLMHMLDVDVGTAEWIQELLEVDGLDLTTCSEAEFNAAVARFDEAGC